MTENAAQAPPADLVAMRRDFDLAVATESAAAGPDELATVRRRQQDLAVAMCAHPYYHQASPNGVEARKRVMDAAKQADPA